MKRYGGLNREIIPKKRTPENSIILAKRYRGSQSSLGTSQTSSSASSRIDSYHYVNNFSQEEGYLQEHYSPKLQTRKLTKANSVDIVNLKQEKPLIEDYIKIANPFNYVNFRARSNSPQKHIKKVQFTDTEPKKIQPTILVKKFFNKNEEKVQPLINESLNRKLKVNEKILNEEFDNINNSSYQKLVAKERTKLKDNKREKKLKYSPPPEDKSLKTADKTKICSTDINKNISDKPYRVSSIYIANMFANGLKLKERFVVAVCIAVVLFTLILVIDVQMDWGMSGHHLVPTHGKVRYVQEEDGQESAYNSFRKRFLQKTHR